MTLPAAAETTAIPIGEELGPLGALMVAAVLAHPGIDAASHRKRDAVLQAMGEYMEGKRAFQAGRQRVTKGSCPQFDKRDRLFATLNRADRAIHTRLRLARIAYDLCGQEALRSFNANGRLIIRISGPASLAKALENLEGRDVRTWWRSWRETLPVLHLAVAVHSAIKDIAFGPRPLTWGMVQLHDQWTEKAIARASMYAMALSMTLNGYDLAQRVDLVPAG